MTCSRCKRTAVSMNLQYHPGEWLCAFHNRIVVKEGRRLRKYGNRINELNKEA